MVQWGFDFSGLPRGWTDSAASAVDRDVFHSMYPKAMETVQPASFCAFNFFCDVEINDCQANKIPIVSLFTGIAGFELGLSQCGPWNGECHLQI